MTRRTIVQREAEQHEQGDDGLSPSAVLPVRPQPGHAVLPVPPPRSFPRQLYSTAYGMTIRRPGGGGGGGVELVASTTTTTKKKAYTILKADLLIPGDGDPVRSAALVIEDNVIAWTGAQSDLPARYTSAPHRAYEIPYLMPGLWDVHVHCTGGSITGEDGPGYTGFITTHPASAGARLARGCWEALQRGYTSLRDVAGLGCEVARAIREGEIVGPNIYSSGACLSQTAGHGDVFNMPAGVVYQSLGVGGHQFGGGVSCIVDGAEECRRAVRLQIRRGARCIKVLASGGVMSRDDDVQRAQFSGEELAVIVEEAARQGRCVAAHAHAKAGILAAVAAGVRTVEHLSFADQECVDLIRARGVVCVPTRFINEYLLSTGGEGLDPASWEKAKLAASHHLAAYRLAIRAGCTIAMGTDTPPGVNAAVELEYAVSAGMSNLEAIKAATVNGALTVGDQAPRTGQLKAGYEADVLGLTANPADDVRILQDKDNIRWVWKGGKIYKGPGVGPWGEDKWWGDDFAG